MDAGRAGINRARGYGNINNRRRSDNDNAASEMPSEPSLSNSGLHRRGVNGNTMPQSTDEEANDSGSIAGLMGLDDQFRMVGSNKNREDETREVQLRGLTRRIMASPSLVFFPAKKEDTDVM